MNHAQQDGELKVVCLIFIVDVCAILTNFLSILIQPFIHIWSIESSGCFTRDFPKQSTWFDF